MKKGKSKIAELEEMLRQKGNQTTAPNSTEEIN